MRGCAARLASCKHDTPSRDCELEERLAQLLSHRATGNAKSLDLVEPMEFGRWTHPRGWWTHMRPVSVL